jgi:Ca2+/Na+ antiporter
MGRGFSMFPLLPMLVVLIYVGVIVYGIVLATRLVNAVERIARSIDHRLPPQG